MRKYYFDYRKKKNNYLKLSKKFKTCKNFMKDIRKKRRQIRKELKIMVKKL